MLYKHYLRIIAEHKPTVFVMENVKGLLSATRKGVGIFERILEDLQHAGSETEQPYDVFPLVQPLDGEALCKEKQNADRFIIKSEEFGVPQARHRLIILGVRRKLRAHRVWLTRHQSRVTVKDVIDDLPPLRSTLSREPDSYDQWCQYIRKTSDLLDGLRDPELRNVMAQTGTALALESGGEFVQYRRKPRKLADWYFDTRLNGICNHSARGHIAADVQRYFFAACFASAHGVSPNLRDFPIQLRPLHSNVKGDDSKWIFTDRFRVQLGDAPSTTITSHISKDGHYYIHYDPRQCRSLTVREAARLQTFPDNYFFCGSRTDQYRQVGNAVPPLLANQIAEAVQRLLSTSTPHKAAK